MYRKTLSRLFLCVTFASFESPRQSPAPRIIQGRDEKYSAQRRKAHAKHAKMAQGIEGRQNEKQSSTSAVSLCGFVPLWLISSPMNIEVTRTYLQLLHPTDLNAARVDDQRVRIDNVVDSPASFYRYLYAEVGRFYHWIDRLPWTDDEIRVKSSQSAPETLWVMPHGRLGLPLVISSWSSQ